MTVPDDLSALKKKPFADAVVRFEQLLAQGGRAFLIGAGCSQCAGLLLTATLTQDVLSSIVLDQTTKDIIAAIRGVGAQIETDRQNPSDGASPTNGARVRPAHVGHRLEYVAREQCLSRSPARCLGSQAIADNRLVSEKRVLNVGLLLVAWRLLPPAPSDSLYRVDRAITNA